MTFDSGSTLFHALVVTLVLFQWSSALTSDEVVPGTPASTLCQEPTDVLEMQRWLRSSIIDHAHLSYNGSTLDLPYIERDVKISSLHDSQCLLTTGRVCNCPHKYEVNFDPGRIPKVLVQARCCWNDDHCVRRWRVGCREVVHHVPVLRRVGCEGGIYQYLQVWEEVPVGCSCFTERRSQRDYNRSG